MQILAKLSVTLSPFWYLFPDNHSLFPSPKVLSFSGVYSLLFLHTPQIFASFLWWYCSKSLCAAQKNAIHLSISILTLLLCHRIPKGCKTRSAISKPILVIVHESTSLQAFYYSPSDYLLHYLQWHACHWKWSVVQHFLPVSFLKYRDYIHCLPNIATVKHSLTCCRLFISGSDSASTPSHRIHGDSSYPNAFT